MTQPINILNYHQDQLHAFLGRSFVTASMSAVRQQFQPKSYLKIRLKINPTDLYAIPHTLFCMIAVGQQSSRNNSTIFIQFNKYFDTQLGIKFAF